MKDICPNCESKDMIKIDLDKKEPRVHAYYCKICGYVWSDMGIDSSTQAIKN